MQCVQCILILVANWELILPSYPGKDISATSLKLSSTAAAYVLPVLIGALWCSKVFTSASAQFFEPCECVLCVVVKYSSSGLCAAGVNPRKLENDNKFFGKMWISVKFEVRNPLFTEDPCLGIMVTDSWRHLVQGKPLFFNLYKEFELW